MSEKAHSILSASGSKRWLSCTPSAKLELEFPEEKSTFAEEGTLAHAFSELYLSLYLGLINKHSFNCKLKKLSEEAYFTEEMKDNVQEYVDFAVERINQAISRVKDSIVLLEQKLDFSPWVPEGFGTGDLIIISDATLEIIDLKYGKGVEVIAKDNSQMKLYALGAIHQFDCLYDIEAIKLTIFQPRLNNISTDEVDIKELLTWAETYVKPRAEMAIKGKGEFEAGEHCRFCRARFTCKARAEESLKAVRFDFRIPTLLTDEEISEILDVVEELQRWASDVYNYALEQAERYEKKWIGFKLVEGRSVRKYKDEAVVAEALIAAGYEENKIYQRSLLSITALEKAIGKKKFNELLGGLIIKPIGKLTLVKDTDKHSEIKAVQSAKQDFAN